MVDFVFGKEEAAAHVILELYAGGNIILTDHRYEILALLRTHSYDTAVTVAVKQLYPVAYATTAVGAETGTVNPVVRYNTGISYPFLT